MYMKTRNRLSLSMLSIAFVAVQCFATVETLSPVAGETVQLLPDAQKKVMSLPTLAERLELFEKDRSSGKVLSHDPL